MLTMEQQVEMKQPNNRNNKQLRHYNKVLENSLLLMMHNQYLNKLDMFPILKIILLSLDEMPIDNRKTNVKVRINRIFFLLHSKIEHENQELDERVDITD
jgi:hypothetical protein